MVLQQLAPVASIRPWRAPPMQTMAGSPPPFGGSPGFSTITVSISGTQEKRGMW
jgi:hypothetical protein